MIKSSNKVWQDSDRNYWMTADEAKEYGMIDQIMVKKGGADEASAKE